MLTHQPQLLTTNYQTAYSRVVWNAFTPNPNPNPNLNHQTTYSRVVWNASTRAKAPGSTSSS